MARDAHEVAGPKCLALADAWCSNVAVSGCRFAENQTLFGRYTFAHYNETSEADIDVDGRHWYSTRDIWTRRKISRGTVREWRCYAREALADDLATYDMHLQSQRFCTRDSQLRQLVTRCVSRDGCVMQVTHDWQAAPSMLQIPPFETAYGAISTDADLLCDPRLYTKPYGRGDRCAKLATLDRNRTWVALDMASYGYSTTGNPTVLSLCAPPNVVVGALSYRKGQLREGLDIAVPPPTKVRNDSLFPKNEHEVEARCRASDVRRLALSFRGSPRDRATKVRLQLQHLHGAWVDGLGPIKVTLLKADLEALPRWSPYLPRLRDQNGTFAEELFWSHFALAPRGDALFSYRLTEIMAAGVVPVIVADDWALAFDELIDWSRTSVVVRENDTASIPAMLAAFSVDAVCAMRRRAFRTFHRFLRSPVEWAAAIETILKRRQGAVRHGGARNAKDRSDRDHPLATASSPVRALHSPPAPLPVTAPEPAGAPSPPQIRAVVHNGAIGHCRCWHTCNPAATQAFFRQLPTDVRHQASPWYAYLRAVYGTDVPLPFPISELRFFYHNGADWQTRHPNVAWPLVACHGERSLKPLPSVPICSPAECARWVESPGAYADTDLAGLHSELYTHHYRSSETRGVRLFHDALHPALAQPNGTWVEVMRWPRACEEANGYGAWFSRAPGSGVFINTNRTWQLMGRLEALGLPPFSPASPGDLVARWLALHNLPMGTSRSNLSTWRRTHPGPIGPGRAGRTLMLDSEQAMRLLVGLGGAWCGWNDEMFPFMAFELGIDTVQMDNRASGPEIVTTGEWSMARPGCCVGCTASQRARNCGFPRNTCSHVELRTGWGASAPCTCLGHLHLLNCDG